MLIYLQLLSSCSSGLGHFPKARWAEHRLPCGSYFSVYLYAHGSAGDMFIILLHGLLLSVAIRARFNTGTLTLVYRARSTQESIACISSFIQAHSLFTTTVLVTVHSVHFHSFTNCAYALIVHPSFKDGEATHIHSSLDQRWLQSRRCIPTASIWTAGIITNRISNIFISRLWAFDTTTDSGSCRPGSQLGCRQSNWDGTQLRR